MLKLIKMINKFKNNSNTQEIRTDLYYKDILSIKGKNFVSIKTNLILPISS